MTAQIGLSFETASWLLNGIFLTGLAMNYFTLTKLSVEVMRLRHIEPDQEED